MCIETRYPASGWMDEWGGVTIGKIFRFSYFMFQDILIHLEGFSFGYLINNFHGMGTG